MFDNIRKLGNKIDFFLIIFISIKNKTEAVKCDLYLNFLKKNS